MPLTWIVQIVVSRACTILEMLHSFEFFKNFLALFWIWNLPITQSISASVSEDSYDDKPDLSEKNVDDDRDHDDEEMSLKRMPLSDCFIVHSDLILNVLFHQIQTGLTIKPCQKFIISQINKTADFSKYCVLYNMCV